MVSAISAHLDSALSALNSFETQEPPAQEDLLCIFWQVGLPLLDNVQ